MPRSTPVFNSRFLRLPVLAILGSLFVAQARADHFAGASITYQCIGVPANEYLVTLDLYLDCSGVAITPQSLSFTNNCGVSFSMANIPLVLTEEVSQLCGSQLANSTCNGGTLPGIQHYQFQQQINLSPCNAWTISWSICCRDVTQNVQLTPGMYVAATINNLGGLCDQSPQIGDQSIPYVCVNEPMSYNMDATDADGNTLVYSFISARYASPAPTNVTYTPGFTAGVPIPGITLDVTTGQIAFTPTVTGNYVVVVQVTSYDAMGNLIGTVMRDFLFVVINCTDPPADNLGPTAIDNGIITSSNDIEVCTGIPFCVDISFSDVDPLAVITLLSQVTSELPGSTFVVNGTNPAVATICWNPDPAFSPASVLIDVNDNACPVENLSSYLLTITVVSPPPLPPDPGSNATISACPGDPNVNLFNQLGGSPDAGGVWTGPNGASHSGTFNPSTDLFGVYTYTVGNGCLSASATVTVNSGSSGNAGTSTTLTTCSTSASTNMFALLGAGAAAGGAWSGPSPVVGGSYNPATMTAGVYTYTVAGTPPCPATSATVTVTENTAPNAGTNGTLTVCSTGAAVSLLAQLGGGPQGGGSWTGPSPVGGAGNYTPASMNPGVYTYTITGVAPCVNATSTVTVTENAAVTAGSNGSLSICATGGAVALSTGLGGAPQAGGSWSGPSPVVGGMYDPATMTGGAYVYTVTGTAPCPNATATVTVTENATTNAGTNGTLTICANAATTSLFAQLGGAPQAGGAWSGPSPVVGGNYNPATMAPGVYTYTVTGVAPCANASATVTVTENAAPSAGTNGNLSVCSNGAAVLLSASLGGTPDVGGAWSGPSPVVGGSYDPATMNAGVYTYTVTGVAPCANATATVTVAENASPNAGTNGTLTVCANGASVALSSGLGGAPAGGGAWSGPSPVVGGNYDPAIMIAGVYTYTVTGIAPCTNASATVTVTENAAPNAGTNGPLTLCSNGASVALSTGLGGAPQVGGAWSGPSPVVGGNYDPATMTAGVYTYTVTGVAPCANASATVTVSENAATNAGANGTLTVCSNGGATSLIAQLGGAPQAGGAWSGPSPVVGGNYDPATMTAGVYTYTVTGVAPCSNASATVTVTENAVANAGTSGSLTLCSNSASVALSSGLGGAPQAGGAWSGPSPVVGGNYDPATMTAGVYTYTVTGVAPCVNASATVTVTENAPTNAGTNGTLTVCSDGATTSLFAQLGGAPQAGGAWSGPSPVVGGNYDPATMTAGVYTYTVTGIAPCPNASATVTVTENAVANAGTNGSLTLCSNGASVALSTGLGGAPQAGGAWSGPSPVVGGNYDPATMTAGVYTYTVTGVAPCTNSTATVTVTENAAPNAGTNGSLTLCSNGAAIGLITGLGGAPGAGGAWSGPSPVVGGSYDPATMAAGVYTYTVNGVAPCANATATVTVTENAATNAGTNGTLTVCSSDALASLLAQLGGAPQAGGAWSGPSPVVGGNYDPATMTAGVYTYTVTGVAPCVNAVATVTVTENAAPSAGTNGGLTLCSNGAVVSLMTGLGGAPQAGGAWSGPSPVVGGNYDPAAMTPGVYTYTVAGAAPCANAAATVTVTENTATNAGTGGTLTVCSSDAPASLLAQLGGAPQAGGAWSGPSPVVGGSYDPATMTAGVYTYTVTGVAPCVNAVATVTVTENAAPSAGSNGGLTLCSNGAVVSLITGLGGAPQAGGAWSGPSPVFGGNYDPAAMTAGVYTYTVTGAAPCANAAATVTVAENTTTNAGTNGTLTVCSSDAPASLLAQLGGAPQAGGAWSGPSPVVGGSYDPATMTAGLYTYTVTGIAPCIDATATVTVTENPVANAGTNGTLTVCSNGAAAGLITLLGGAPQAGGAWSGPSPVVGGNYDPATMTAGVYTYTVTGVAPCASASATVTVTENAATNAGTNGSLALCSSDASASLLAQLGGAPQAGGAWSGPSPVVGGNYDPATMAPGVYTYTVSGVAPCANASATITVTENAAPNAGTNGSLMLCSNGASIGLITGLGGAPGVGGAWSGPSPVVGGNYDPATMTAGSYTYTVTGVAPCVNATATVTVTENAATNAGTNGTLTLCSSDASTSLFAQLGGAPQAGGVWSGPSPVVGGNYDPSTMAPGAYSYTITGIAPCANSTATVTVTENATPNAGANGALTVCDVGAAVSLSAQLGGTPSAGGAWSGPSPVIGGNYDPATMTAGVYTYTVTGIAPCANASATVAVTETSSPDAGVNSVVTVCGNGAATNLFTQLGGTPDAGGTWSGPSAIVGGSYDPATMNPGVYTYTLNATAPCVSASATVTVAENAPTNAGANGAITVCDIGAAVNLFSQLGGTPSVGGAWSGPSPVAGGNYDPATMTAGVYTYTVTGVAPCANASATVTVTETSSPDAGSNGNVTVCGNGAATNLFTQLGGTPDAGGTWSGPSPIIGGSYDPATMNQGVYTYTLNATAPCLSASATVTVAENAPTNAGTDGSITVCDIGAAVNLFAQLGGAPAAGGAWSGPSPVVGGNYDPATMTAGVYTYTVTGVAPCANASATVSVTETSSPDAGSNGNVTVCGNGAATNLFTQLGGTPDAGGTWSGPSPIIGGSYDPATMNQGVYTYTLNATAPCLSASATVTVTENAPTNAGTDGSIAVCDIGAAVNLFAQLGGAPAAGGAWSGPSPVVGGNYDPATMTAGVYTYTVTGVAPCANASATVSVTETSSPDAGSNGNVTVCGNGAATNLFGQLGGTPDAGGTWSGPSAIVGGSYDPATMNPGVYTYTLNATAPCVSASATVTVTENAPTNAGANGAITVCDIGAAVNLLAQLGGAPAAGGAWSGPSPVVGGNYDPATMTAGVYTYTVTGIAPCANASATVTVTETSSPDAGSNGSVTVCGDGGATDLYTELGGTPDAGGTWSGPSAIVGGSYDPATMSPGVYTYTLNATAPCVSTSATVTVTENAATNAGTNGAITVCDIGAAVNLLAQLGGAPAAGGAWSGPSPVVGGNYDPATMTAGVYTYTVAGVAPCTNASATVTVTETSSPDAGSNGNVTVCGDGAATDLYTELGGAPDAGGTWSGPSAVVGGSYDPATMNPGVYTYTLSATAPCVSASATVTVTENTPTNAGTDGSITVCDIGAAVNLFAQLGGAPSAGGTWSGPGPVVGGNYDPATMTAGVYTYTVAGVAPCTNASATVTVTETSSPDAGSNGSVTVCGDGGATDLYTQLGGTPDAGGTWSGPSAVVGGSYDPATMNPGVYTYTLSATAPCVSASATVTVAENAPTNAGTDGSITVCDIGAAVNLFAQLGGAPAAGGAWSGPSPVVGGNYDPATMTAGVYTYTVTGVAPCADAAATVTVAETSSPDAGVHAVIALCSSSGPTDLFTQLGGTPDGGGAWSGPSVLAGSSFDPATMTAGIYTYTITGTAPCLSASADVTVTVETAPDAGLDGSIQLCPGSATVDLFTLLGGSPQAGGTWSGPSGTFDGTFDPGSDPAGDHTYTIAGIDCPTSSAVVTVTVLPGPDAGDNNIISVCNTQAAFTLISQLQGTPDAGGSWTNAQGVGVPSTFDPATGTSSTFTYTVSGSANCPDDQATLAITVNIAPQAGTNGSLTLCASSPEVSLFDGLGGTLDAGGTWTGPDAQPHGTILDPAVDVSGAYTYTVTGVAPCVDASAVVNLTINPVPYAGEDGQLIICTSAPAVSLISVLGGVPQTGGTWSDPNGQPSNGSFAPSTGTEGAYTYTITGLAPCINDFSTVMVETSIAGNAGGDASITLCFDGPEVDLFTQLTGQPDANGAWTAPDGTPSAGFFDPASATAGSYTYTVTPPVPCPAVSATVDVDVLQPVVTTFLAESAGSCAPLEVSFSHGYTGPGTCTWILGNGDIVQDCAPFLATYNDPGSYDVTLIIDAGNICGADTVTIEDAVLVYTQPVADFEMVPPNINTLDPLAYLNNTSVGANAYEWTIDDAFTSTDEDVRYLFSAELGADHTICLVAIAAASCTDTICKFITVEDGLAVYVPNTFTVDNNGVNETFKPIVVGIDPRFYLFEIYDRWGLRFFSTTDPEAFWDGTLGGEQAPQDVYVWKLIAKDAYSGDRVERIGHVTLLR